MPSTKDSDAETVPCYYLKDLCHFPLITGTCEGVSS